MTDVDRTKQKFYASIWNLFNVIRGIFRSSIKYRRKKKDEENYGKNSIQIGTKR